LGHLTRSSVAFGALTAGFALVCAFLACAPAFACSGSQVTKGAGMAETRFDSPVSGRIVIQCWTEDRETIALAAEDDAAVRAAQSGVVAYAGALKGYGEAVMIRHAGGFVSAIYGDIGDLRVKRGDHVERGQPIAVIRSAQDSMGIALRFEIRRGAKAVDARSFMSTPEPPIASSAGYASME
jgi:septal ring factor EnvC (AmiA/AmiB activator)